MHINHARLLVILRAVGFVMLGYFAYASGDVFAKTLTQYYPPGQIVTLFCIEALIITTTWIIITRPDFRMSCRHLAKHLLRGALVAGIGTCAVRALDTIPIADLYTVTYFAPLILVISARIFMKEHFDWQKLVAIIVGFIGIVIVAGPKLQSFEIGYIFAIATMLCMGFSLATVRAIGPGDPKPFYLFFPFLFGLLYNSYPAYIHWQPVASEHLSLFLIAPLCGMSGNLCLAMGYGKSPNAALVAPFQYTSIIWGVLYGYLFFGDILSVETMIGAAIIMAAGLYVIVHEYKLTHKEHSLHILG